MWVELHAVTGIGTPIDDQIRPELLVARASSRMLVARASVLFLEVIAFLRHFSFVSLHSPLFHQPPCLSRRHHVDPQNIVSRFVSG